MQRKQELSRNGFKHWYTGVVNSTREVSGVQETGHQLRGLEAAQGRKLFVDLSDVGVSSEFQLRAAQDKV